MSQALYKNYVNGKFMDNKTGERFSVVNPATGEEIYQMEKADEHVLSAAVESAQKRISNLVGHGGDPAQPDSYESRIHSAEKK